MTSCSQPQTPPHAATVRSVPFAEWPEADRFAATTARRPAERLKRGGAASHMKDITFRDLARRYGYFLDYVQRTEGLDLTASAASYVTPARVDAIRRRIAGARAFSDGSWLDLQVAPDGSGVGPNSRLLVAR